jgi:hypothetical protein
MLYSPPEYLRTFLKKYPNKGLAEILPHINEDVLDKYKFYKSSLKPKELSNFLLSLISETLLTIYGIFEKKNLKNMGAEYIGILARNILGFEKKLTNYIVIYYRKSTSIEDVDNTEMKDKENEEQKHDDFDEFVDTPREIEVDDEEEVEIEDVDPFSLNDVDVEDEEDEDLFVDVADRLS